MKYQPKKAARKQGFDLSYSESPIDNPEGWYDGSVHQTGGMVMCRIWRTQKPNGEDKQREVEYECSYNQDSFVSLSRFVYDESWYGYVHDETIETRQVEENTDERKAEVAKELMEQFERED